MTRTLSQWLVYIEQMHPSEMELGLARISAVAERMALLPLACRTIIVAGTNGKGSTVALMDGLARAAGYRTGVYTSPHLFRFNERIRVNGAPVDDASLCRAFEDIEQARADIPLTYFEFTTLAGLRVFGAQALDLCILEVGLGGRLDAVNIVDADVAVVTSIGLDHTDWLGETRELIAAEKAGVRRPSKPLVFAGPDMPDVIPALCAADGVPLLVAGDAFGGRDGKLHWRDVSAERRHHQLAHDVALGEDNLAAAVQALALVGLLTPSCIDDVAARTKVTGRRQSVLCDGVEWVFDVGHNAEALQRFSDHLPRISGRTVALVGMLIDKPAEKALAPFVSTVSRWYLAGLFAGQNGTRSQSAQQLSESLPPDADLGGCFVSVSAAVSAIKECLLPGDRVLVFGSFYTVAEAAQALAISLE